VTEISIGRYSVAFEGFDTQGVGGGHVQAGLVGGSGDWRCGIDSWSVTTPVVQCAIPPGVVWRGPFSVLYIRPKAVPEPGSGALLAAGIGGLLVLGRRRALRRRVNPASA
jgi:hypothetical protein